MMLVTVEFTIREGMESEFETCLNIAHDGIAKYDGFLGEEPCRSLTDETRFVTLFYFRDRASIETWRKDAEHLRLQQRGRNDIFSWYRIRVAEVERQYGSNEPEGNG